MTLHWPQLTMLGLFVFADGIALAMHGKPKGNYNFGTSFAATVITVAILYAGGFFG